MKIFKVKIHFQFIFKLGLTFFGSSRLGFDNKNVI